MAGALARAKCSHRVFFLINALAYYSKNSIESCEFASMSCLLCNRMSSCGGACQHSMCNGAHIQKHFTARNVHIKISISQFSSVSPPGTKAAISQKWNGLSAPNF